MASLSSVIQLVQSLSRSEKRSFSVFAGLLQGEKDYLQLYHIVQSGKEHEVIILPAFQKKCPNADLNATAHYLYQVLMKCLLTLHQENYLEEQLLTGIQEARILFRKGLIHEGFALLGKLRKLATDNEKIIYCIVLDKLEINYYTQLQYVNLKEEDLLKIQGRLRRNIQYELNLVDHSSLYELLNYRFLLNGTARDQKDKDKLNDLVVSEMSLAGNPRYQSFDLKKNHLLFQSVYFMMTGDNKSSLATYFELNQLFETHRQLWNETPVYYIHHIKGILSNLHLTGQFVEMDFFIDRLTELKAFHPLIILEQTIYVSSLKKLLGLKKYDQALQYIDVHLEFQEKLNQLTSLDKAEVALYISITYFNQKTFKKAAKSVQSIIHGVAIPNKQLLRIIRLINLIIHFEMNDFEYLNSEIRSLERDFKHSDRNYRTETIVLKMMKKYPFALSRSSRKNLFDTILAELIKCCEASYEMPLFRVFDFREWIEKKI
jgi:hypothetical protein